MIGKLRSLIQPGRTTTQQIKSSARLPDPFLCGILQSRSEIQQCVAFLTKNNYRLHPCEPKNWDLAHILPEVGRTGDFLDMGSWESYVLANLAQRDDYHGRLFGIDLQEPAVKTPRVTSLVGDLTHTALPGGSFQYISCVSVIEHGVEFPKFAKEASRLLQPGGKLFVTFDYWEPRVTTSQTLYGLPWDPLDRSAVERLIFECGKRKLVLAEDMDWSIGDAVIDGDYHSPLPSMRYTFGLTTFIKAA